MMLIQIARGPKMACTWGTRAAAKAGSSEGETGSKPV